MVKAGSAEPLESLLCVYQCGGDIVWTEYVHMPVVQNSGEKVPSLYAALNHTKASLDMVVGGSWWICFRIDLLP